MCAILRTPALVCRAPYEGVHLTRALYRKGAYVYPSEIRVCVNLLDGGYLFDARRRSKTYDAVSLRAAMRAEMPMHPEVVDDSSHRTE